MQNQKIYKMAFAKVYPLYINKAQRKGRSKEEVDRIIFWLTGYSETQLELLLANNTDVEAFFQQAPRLNPARKQITGVICGVRIEEITQTMMQEIRYLDKLVDELAKGKALEKILRA
ncbi:DUF2200 domain-containing protein [Pseudoalteromonas sp. JB197]|uniref:DUF2200 domain-containing protein n=1 Tax=Pseudoalteromonas sp. JB197 TaxID=1434839 RepID=UPI00097ED3D1|nr:DUF2200 domain-containing protein [Pseudoalteromonas sp. JB197]PCC10728.1 DUF2200 domain-containing protein [Pseudoalteromonas sp. JB197]SJN49474.1 hypothetical protein CZ797_17915 [Pseudoalteromonas sp. JB197]